MRSLIAPLTALALVSGCVVQKDEASHSHSAQPGDITILWSFAGQTCQQADGVAIVRVTLQRAGSSAPEILENDGYYPCTFAGIDGLKLTNFRAGSYSYTVDALDGTSDYARVLYTASGTLTVNGPVTVSVNLTRVYTTGALEVFWDFGSNVSCADAAVSGGKGIENVRIQLDQFAPYTVNCSWGSAVFDDLEPRTYQVQVEGLVGENVWYRGAQTVTIGAGRSEDLHVGLDPVAGSAVFTPMTGSYTNLDCASSGVKALWIKLVDSSGDCWPKDESGNCGYSDECATYATAGFKFDYLPAGDEYDSTAASWFSRWTVMIEGWDSVSPQVHNVLYSGTRTFPIYAGQENKYGVVLGAN